MALPVQRKHNIVYKTTCVVTGTYYIGIHATDDLDDGYLGSGNRLKNSIKKYGQDAHLREIIADCLSYAEARDIEASLVTWDSIKEDKKLMNQVPGGQGGDLISEHPRREEILAAKSYQWMQDPLYREKMRQASTPKTEDDLRRLQTQQRKMVQDKIASGYRHSEETKAKISQNNKSGTNEVRVKIACSNLGKKNPEHSKRQKDRFSDKSQHPRTKRFVLTSPEGQQHAFIGVEALSEFCSGTLSLNLLLRNVGQVVQMKTKLQEVGKSTVGWKLETVK
jgi:hypothetical protein